MYSEQWNKASTGIFQLISKGMNDFHAIPWHRGTFAALRRAERATDHEFFLPSPRAWRLLPAAGANAYDTSGAFFLQYNLMLFFSFLLTVLRDFLRGSSLKSRGSH